MRTGRRLLAGVVAAAVVALGGYAAAPRPPAGGTRADWTTYNGTSDEQRFSALDQINPGNVAQLGLAWSHQISTPRGQEATPLVVDGVMYVTTSWNHVLALDAATGAELWHYDPKVPGSSAVNACCDMINRGAAYHDGKLFFATIDGRLIALEAKTGKPRWSVQTLDTTKPYSISGAPRVARGKVFIGNSGAEYGVRGYISAYDEATGTLAWRFYTVPGDPAKRDHAASDAILEKLARKTWFGDKYYKYGGGGTVWDSIVYDADFNRLYIGVGNGGPWNRRLRSEDKGDNLFLGSIVALDPDTGKYLWHYQETPGDTWDFTSAQQITLATLPVDGTPRKVILHAPKNGFFYILDRASGKLLSATKYAPINWASQVDMKTGRPVENPDARFQQKPFLATSGALGAHNWQPMSFDPATGLVYIPAQQAPFVYTKDEHFQYRPGLWAIGVDFMSTPLPETPEQIKAMNQSIKGWLLAWDPVAQKEAWRAPHDGIWNGGVLSTGGGLVFQGLADATFRAYRADSGAELWKFDAKSPIIAGGMSYMVGGTQYVAVLAGNGGAPMLSMPAVEGPQPQPPGRILVFKLGGTATLPDKKPTLAAIRPAQDKWSAEQTARGERLFGQICAGCHGMAAMSAGVVPDLRRSPFLQSREAWQQVVIKGALTPKGMVSFAKYISPDEAETVRGYVSQQAEKALARQAATPRP